MIDLSLMGEILASLGIVVGLIFAVLIVAAFVFLGMIEHLDLREINGVDDKHGRE